MVLPGGIKGGLWGGGGWVGGGWGGVFGGGGVLVWEGKGAFSDRGLFCFEKKIEREIGFLVFVKIGNKTVQYQGLDMR